MRLGCGVPRVVEVPRAPIRGSLFRSFLVVARPCCWRARVLKGLLL